MKVGILTFHAAHNYGAMLQAYALQQFLISQGMDAWILDYSPERVMRAYRLFDLMGYLRQGTWRQRIKTICSRLLLLPKSWKRRAAFEQFVQQALLLAPFDPEGRDHSYDAFVFGSDQIWNPHLSDGFDPVYFGDFEAARGKRLIAYAASMGATRLDVQQQAFYRSHLAAFEAISVREASLQQLLAPLTPKPVKVVSDPTFLLPATAWMHLSKPSTIAQPYVLVYQVLSHPETLFFAQRIAHQIGGKVVCLKAKLSLSESSPYQYATPQAFLGYVQGAACVVTTSFHGTAFSVIFNRPFYTLRLHTDADARSADLLQALGLEERMVEADSMPVFTPVDYRSANLALKQLADSSAEFLMEALR